MSEHLEQCKVIQWARGSGLRPGAVLKYPCLAWLYAIPNGQNKTKFQRQYFKAEGLMAGISDLCLPFPSKGYHGLYIEMKWQKNKPSKEQKDFIEYAISVGYKVDLCYTSEDAIAVIEEYLR